MPFVVGSVVVALLALVPAVFAWRMLAVPARARGRDVLAVVGAGAVLGVVCLLIERWFWGVTGLSLSLGEVGLASALLAMVLFAAPLEEGAKLLVVWPLYRFRTLASPGGGLLFGCAVGAGFAAGEVGGHAVLGSLDAATVLRGAVAAIAHPFFASAWAYPLGSRARTRWFSWAWLLSVVFHGLFAHLVFGRGVGTVGAAVPIAVVMLAMTLFAVRSTASSSSRAAAETEDDELIPASLAELRIALRAPAKPASVLWGLFAGIVTSGVVLTSIALGVYVGHRIGIDFAAANEDDVRSNGPVVLLGAAAVMGFPIAGYLVAKASAAHSMLEPALGAGVAIAAAILGLYWAAPIAVVFAVAGAPVAFILACVGAWFGMER